MLPEGRSIQKSRDLLKGAIDIHIHAGPHLTTSPRSVTPVEAAVQARRVGMKAIVYMDVFQMSNGTAQIVNEVVPDFITYGGVNLNTVFGGINPRAVRTSLTYAGGAKYVAFGTHSTHWMASREGHVIDGVFKPFHTFDEKFRREELGRSIRIPVDEAPTPEIVEILEMLAVNDVDLVVTDLNMPQMDGLELSKNLRSDTTYDDTPIIMITTEASSVDRKLGMDAGVTTYLTKPISPQRLVYEIEKVIR